MDRRYHLAERLKDYDLRKSKSKRRYNEKLFAAVSGRYAVARRLLSFGLDSFWKRRLLRLLPSRDGLAVLDLACGTGELTAALARRYPKGIIAGIDLSQQMLRRARRRHRNANLRFRQGDMMSLPFADRSFDAVTGGYALRNSPDLAETLDEIHRILEPGGSAVFLDFSAFTLPNFRNVQIRLIGLWGSLWGVLLHGNREVYGYIAESLSLFPDRRALEQMLKRHFQIIRSRSLFFSFVRLTLCRREA